MRRIELLVIAVSLIPLMMAIIFRAAVIPHRKGKMAAALKAANAHHANQSDLVTEDEETNRYIAMGSSRINKDFDSLYSSRLLIPAALLSFIYLITFSLGISSLVTLNPQCHTTLCIPCACLPLKYLKNPAFASLGAYIFNLGVLVRRAYLTDLTRNVFWSAIYRLLFAVGASLPLYLMTFDGSYAKFGTNQQAVLSFSIAFFPGLFLTMLKKGTSKLFDDSTETVTELDLKLIQGIDLWKEERLEEEGIESVQNLATADVLSLAVKTHYPIRTIVDWIDQAIFIQRFPKTFKIVQDTALTASAIDLAWMSTMEDNEPVAPKIADKIGAEAIFVKRTMRNLYEDAAVRILWRLWQTGEIDE